MDRAGMRGVVRAIEPLLLGWRYLEPGLWGFGGAVSPGLGLYGWDVRFDR